MATTTNYSWSTPDNTAYVKDGASAIRTLGSSVDTTLFTALGGTYPGLRLIKKQTIGSGITSVTVTGAFSATYEKYKIVVTGGSASANNTTFTLTLGSTTTNYNWVLDYNGYATTGGQLKGSSATGHGYAGNANVDGICVDIDVTNAFLSKQTWFNNFYSDLANTGIVSGFLNNTTSYTAFTLATGAAITGGTIYVYGYGVS